jgi:hypothetical protein
MSTPQEIAWAFEEQAAAGTGAAPAQNLPHSLDRPLGSAGSRGNRTIKYSVLGDPAPAVGQSDQTPFFNQIPDPPLAPAPLFFVVVPTPAVPTFNAQQVTAFVALNPMSLRNMNLTGAIYGAGPAGAELVAGGRLDIVRATPFGSTETEEIYFSTYLTTQDFQSTRIQIPIAGEIIDGYTYCRIVTPQDVAGQAGYSIAWLFGPRMDRRAEVPNVGAAVVRSPGA